VSIRDPDKMSGFEDGWYTADRRVVRGSWLYKAERKVGERKVKVNTGQHDVGKRMEVRKDRLRGGGVCRTIPHSPSDR
jgi:hypothetical protein